MKTLRAILVDDEPNCCESLEWQLKHYCHDVEVVATCNTGSEAVDRIRQEKPDVVFMDIQLQEMSGFDVLSQIKSIDFNIIFVTAYEDYAIKAIQFNALDYLLKPVSPDELKKSIERVFTSLKQRPLLSREILEYFNEISNRPVKEVKRIALSTSESLQFINIEDIIYCESESNYTQFILKDGRKVMLSKTLKSIEEILDKRLFYRIHQSYLINLNRVTKYIRSEEIIIMDNNSEIPVSQNRKDGFMKVFARF